MAQKYDWDKIKKDYITGKMTYTALCKKYGIKRQKTLEERAASERWVELRGEYRGEVEKLSLQKEAKKKAKETEKTRKRISEVSDKLLDKIFVLADCVCKAGDIKDLTTALSNIQRVCGIKSEADQREQAARTEALINQVERKASDGPQRVNVVITGAEEYAD